MNQTHGSGVYFVLLTSLVHNQFNILALFTLKGWFRVTKEHCAGKINITSEKSYTGPVIVKADIGCCCTCNIKD